MVLANPIHVILPLALLLLYCYAISCYIYEPMFLFYNRTANLSSATFFMRCHNCSATVLQCCVQLRMHTNNMLGWPEPYLYGVYTVILAGKSPKIRSYMVYIYGSGQP